ncbi:unnamed protein product [Cylicocyclus nassatus]|uniref:Uncharacterized protein n=1 Tax=Cylicocyclus nassatus TaxID=53992 RepID=A0AA36H707_CYLNA|nr:unnamed protein product [Cylicocyclus nassatus]
MSLRKTTDAEKRYRTKTEGGRSMHEEDVFEKTDNHCPFDSPSEQALWEFFDKTPVTLPFKEGESWKEVGDDDDVLSLEANMVALTSSYIPMPIPPYLGGLRVG